MKYCLVLLLIIAIGCSVEPKIPSGPTSSVSGYALLFDAGGNPVASSQGITVTSGTGTSAQTNDSGKWTLTGLPSEKNTFIFSRSGFGTMKIFDFQTSGKDTSTDEVDMCQPPTDEINFQRFTISFSEIDSVPSYNIIGSMQPPFLQTRSVVLCISTDSIALSNDPASASILLQFTKEGSGYDGSFSWSSSSAFDLQKEIIPHGTKLYATVCILGIGPNAEYFSNYFDPILGKQVYTALGKHSQILRGIVP